MTTSNQLIIIVTQFGKTQLIAQNLEMELMIAIKSLGNGDRNGTSDTLLAACVAEI